MILILTEPDAGIKYYPILGQTGLDQPCQMFLKKGQNLLHHVPVAGVHLHFARTALTVHEHIPRLVFGKHVEQRRIGHAGRHVVDDVRAAFQCRPGRPGLQRIHGKDHIRPLLTKARHNRHEPGDFLTFGHGFGKRTGGFRPQIEHPGPFVQQTEAMSHGVTRIDILSPVGKRIRRYVHNAYQTKGGRVQHPPPSKNPFAFVVHAAVLIKLNAPTSAGCRGKPFTAVWFRPAFSRPSRHPETVPLPA